MDRHNKVLLQFSLLVCQIDDFKRSVIIGVLMFVCILKTVWTCKGNFKCVREVNPMCLRVSLNLYSQVTWHTRESLANLKPLFHSSQKPTRKLAASAFKHCDWMKVLAASLRVGFRDERKKALTLIILASQVMLLAVGNDKREKKSEKCLKFVKQSLIYNFSFRNKNHELPLQITKRETGEKRNNTVFETFTKIFHRVFSIFLMVFSFYPNPHLSCE